jgi:hypothetical protein
MRFPAPQEFDPERRKQITDLVRRLLRSRRDEPSKAPEIVRALEVRAASSRRRGDETGSETEIRAGIPLDIARKAHALQSALAKRPLTERELLPRTLRDRMTEGLTLYKNWNAFSMVLKVLAARAPKNERPRDERARALDRHVLGVLDRVGLLARTNQNVADILAEIKADVLGRPVPPDPRARVKALRDACKKRASP